MKIILTALIRAYGYVISPLSGAKCRFYPTCSAYTAEAINTHGAAKGVLMGIKRIAKCHPYYKGPMIDKVPERIDWAAILGYKRRECQCSQHTHENER